MTAQEYADAIFQAADDDQRERLLNQAKQELDGTEMARLSNTLKAAGGFDSLVRVAEAAATEAQTAERGSRIVQQATEQGATPAQTKAALEAEGADPIDFNFVDPPWLMETFGGQVLSEEQRQQVLEVKNDLMGTDFDTYEEMVKSGALDNPPPPEREEIAAVLNGERDPFPSLTIRLAKGKQFSVASDEWEEAAKRYGYDSDAMTRIVRMADANNMRGADGEYVAWQPLAALLRASGWQSDQKRQTDLSTKYQALYNEIKELEAQAPTIRRGGQQLANVQAKIAARKKQLAEMGNNFGSGKAKVNVGEVARNFNEGLAKFDYDPGMAYIYAQDAGLAARIKATNGDRSLLSGQDRALISRYVGNGGYNDADDFIVSMLQQGYAEADTSGSLVANYLKALEVANAGAGGGRERILPDPVQVQQAAKDLYRSLFLEDPDENTLASLSATVSSAISSAPDNQNVDIEARIRDSLEGSSQYTKYYGQKPGGMTEAEYRTQFGAAQQSILGAETAGNSSVRLGMQSGKYQTTVGAAAGTQEAWDNSTWLGRLAQAADSVSRNT